MGTWLYHLDQGSNVTVEVRGGAALLSPGSQWRERKAEEEGKEGEERIQTFSLTPSPKFPSPLNNAINL